MAQDFFQMWQSMAAPWMNHKVGTNGFANGGKPNSLPMPMGANMVGPWSEYMLDSMQRTILFWDILRKRGNQYMEHRTSGKPPVLTFDYEVILDGRNFDRPVNYQLVRITPLEGVDIDPAARPYVVFDPRAGHGPGIGGFKEASQVGVAMRAGHQVYLASFLPEPVEGQTIEDVARAEVKFIEHVIELHPESQSKPAIVGNCQGGWALMLMASIAPSVPGVISIAGSPLSYWAGERGVNPMRYVGGLMGGSWMASLAADLGNGKFDGANLVSNFDQLNPANTYWSKLYNVYANADTEEKRFLGFERWWGGLFYLTADEIRFIVDELFVGNKLANGNVVLSDGHRVDLRDIKSPIVVIASWGDNITPPQQALNWVLDLYDSVDEMRARQQTIIYTVHPTIGHLGIFVSAKVALKEHSEFVGALDMIETLPPGLYEMVIVDEETVDEDGDEGGHSQFVVQLEMRELDDIRKLDDGRDDEKPFQTLARMSEVNEAMYDTFMRPMVQMMSNDLTAQMLREMQPPRVERALWSDQNPALFWLPQVAEAVKENRQKVDPENPFLKAEKEFSKRMVAFLDSYRDRRDNMYEQMFYSIWQSPLVEAMTGMSAAYADARKEAAPNDTYREWVELKLKSLYEESEEGDFAEAVYRIGFACLEAGKVQDARAYRMTRKIAKDHPRLKDLTREQVKEKARRAAFIVQFDPEGALETLPYLLPSQEDREDAINVIKGIVSWRPDMAPEHAAVIEKAEQVLFGGKRGPRPIVEDGVPAAS